MMKESLFNLVWNLHDRRRAALCCPLGVGLGLLVSLLLHWTWELSFLMGWILAVGSYLLLLGIVIVSADGPMTQRRVSKREPNRRALRLLTIVVLIFGTGTVGQLLTAVGKQSFAHSRLVLLLSVVAVLLAWLLLHTAFGVHYARLYYEAKDGHGHPFKEGRRSGFRFPGTETPAYLDFLYVSFTVALTYSMSDVNVENRMMRRTVLIHSIVSFFFYSTVLAGVVNAILTS